MEIRIIAVLLAILGAFCLSGCSQDRSDMSNSVEHDRAVAAYGLAWSSDGTLAVLHRSQLSRLRDGSITLIRKNASPVQVGDSVWELRGWSSDGRYLMFLESTHNLQRPYQLIVYDKNSQRLFNLGDDTVFDACWSGKDKITLCSQSPLDATEKLTTLSLSGKVLDINNLQVGSQQLLALALAYDSPADRIAVIAHNRPNGSRYSQPELFMVDNGQFEVVSGTLGCNTVTANPIQSQIAVSLTGSQTRQIAVVNGVQPSSGTSKVVVASPLPLNCDVTNLAYSPDGKHILVTALEKTFPNHSDILLYDIVSGAFKPIIRGNLATFSPDGRRIVYVGVSPDKESHQYVNQNTVYTCNLSGGDVNLIDNSVSVMSPYKAISRLIIGILMIIIVILFVTVAYNRTAHRSTPS